jgi:ketosteroid isomerase-like protein
MRGILPTVSEASAVKIRGTRIEVPRLSERAARTRSIDERVYLRAPALYRNGVRFFTRVPQSSRLRRAILARTIVRAYAAGNRRDFDLLLLTHHPDHQYRPARNLMPPDMETVLRGSDGYLEVWGYWLGAFDDIRWEPREILDFGNRFLVVTTQSGTGSGSGLKLSEEVFQVFELRDGLVFRQDDFLDRDAALAAASAS